MSDSDDSDDGWEEEYSIKKYKLRPKKKRVVYYGRIFPGGNCQDEIILFKYLITKNVRFNVYSDGKNGSAFLIKEKELQKLPQWEGEPFLPTSDRGDSGFSMYPLSKEDLKVLKMYDVSLEV